MHADVNFPRLVPVSKEATHNPVRDGSLGPALATARAGEKYAMLFHTRKVSVGEKLALTIMFIFPGISRFFSCGTKDFSYRHTTTVKVVNDLDT